MLSECFMYSCSTYPYPTSTIRSLKNILVWSSHVRDACQKLFLPSEKFFSDVSSNIKIAETRNFGKWQAPHFACSIRLPSQINFSCRITFPGNTRATSVFSVHQVCRVWTAIAQSVWRRTTGWTAGVLFPVGARDFCLLHSFQTCSGAHPMGTDGLSPGVKRQGREADHSPPSSTEIKNYVGMPPLPHTSS
jgi:hypothetical protein